MPEKVFATHGSAHITGLIEEAVRNGSRVAVVIGNWEIETAVRIPGDFTLVLDGCHLKMADGVYANLFVNEHHDTDIGRTVEGTDHNITILGRNGAILDGGNYNGLSEKTQLTNGLPPIWKNNLLLFTNVDGFEIRNLSCHNQRWWAMNFIFCSNGKLENLHFQSNDTAIDENGNVYHGLRRSGYGDVLVKNSDGIDLRMGCHHITIENITGFTEDDAVALTGLDGIMQQHFMVEGLCPDIHHITVKNVATASYCSNMRLLNQGGIKLHDIYIDGIYDTSENSPHMDRGNYAIRLGDRRLYGSRQCTSDEFYNITVRNIRSRAEFAVSLGVEPKNLVLENVEVFDGAGTIEGRHNDL